MATSDLSADIISQIIRECLINEDSRESIRLREVNKVLLAHSVLGTGSGGFVSRCDSSATPAQLVAARVWGRRNLQGLLVDKRPIYARFSKVEGQFITLLSQCADLLRSQLGGSVTAPSWKEREGPEPLEWKEVSSNPIFSDEASIIVCDAVNTYFGIGYILEQGQWGVPQMPDHADARFQEMACYCMSMLDAELLLFAAACLAGNRRLVQSQLLQRLEQMSAMEKRRLFFGEANTLLGPLQCLNVAIGEDQAKIVRILLDSGLVVNQSETALTGNWDDTAIETAADRGRLNIIQLLLEPKYALRRNGFRYEQAIKMAARQDDPDLRMRTVQLSWSSGDNLDTDAPNKIFGGACEGNDVKLANWTMRQGPINFSSIKSCSVGSSALCIAMEPGNVEVVRFLIQNLQNFVPVKYDIKEAIYKQIRGEIKKSGSAAKWQGILPEGTL
ncbi:hypothetical protein OHC33_002695 [Knufia fluminis]|uniref:Uncharacterized protein n=1 Tax=Knufia fluminis TaxID=191047 RepID=A0AAN8IQJ2_9EURO|nr:hypothetical protein OHC33_002695 [Knufia fluminis]